MPKFRRASKKPRTLAKLSAIVALAAAGFSFAVFNHRHVAESEHDRAPAPAPNADISSARGPAQAPPPSIATPPPICSHFYENVCQKRGLTRDPTGIVRPDIDGEIQALRIYEEIIHKHPEWTSEQVDEELVRSIYTPKRLERVREAYNWVKAAIERLIQRQPDRVLNPKEKKQLIEKIQAVKLDLPPPAAAYSDEPDLFTKNDVYYERTANGQTRMRVGGAYLFSAKSRFNLIFTMGHEFAHSIDPCELRAADIELKSYKALTSCFLEKKFVVRAENFAECGEGDPMSETFADWVAVQVTADALRTETVGYTSAQIQSAATNAIRDLCEQEDSTREADLTNHPEPRIRIQNLFGNQSEIRAVLGCPALPQPDLYCSFESVNSPGNHR